MPSNGTGPYATGSMAGSGMGGGSATATNTPIYTGAASAQKAAGGVAGLGLALIGLLYACRILSIGNGQPPSPVVRLKAQAVFLSGANVEDWRAGRLPCRRREIVFT